MNVLLQQAMDNLRDQLPDVLNPKVRPIIFLCLGGSHAYGTNVPESDVDIRGCALNSRQDIPLMKERTSIRWGWC